MTKHRDTKLFAPPWRHRNADGTMGAEYGPKTASTFARHVARYKDWSFKVATPSKAGRSADADELRRWMRLSDGTLRQDVPDGEAKAYLLVCEQGFSERTAAAKLDCSRRTVRVRLARLAEKAGGDE